MGQDFTKGLNVCIGNYGYYNEGIPNAVFRLLKTDLTIALFNEIFIDKRV